TAASGRRRLGCDQPRPYVGRGIAQLIEQRTKHREHRDDPFCSLFAVLVGRSQVMTERNPADYFMSSGDSRWMLEVDEFDQQLEPTIEAVFAMLNGYLGTRAAVEEGSPVSRPATFIAGVFDTSELPQAPELEAP